MTDHTPPEPRGGAPETVPKSSSTPAGTPDRAEPTTPHVPVAHALRDGGAAADDVDAELASELAAERANLDGHTLEELTDYLDRGRTPIDESIEASSACHQAIADLVRLREMSQTILQTEAANEPVRDATWIQRIMTLISLDAQSGRDIPYTAAHDDADLSRDPDGLSGTASVSDVVITEGAVRGIVRAAGDLFEGILLGRCRLQGDVTIPGEPVRIVVDASVFWGANIPELVSAVRKEIFAAIRLHTDLNVTGVDVIVHELQIRDGRHPKET